MQALVINGAHDLALVTTPVPQPGKGQVRIAVDYVGICGSDLHYYFEGVNGAFVVREPLIPGHEVSGRIDLDPTGRLEPGTPVTVHPARFGECQRGIEREPHLWPKGSYLGSASTIPHTQGAMSELLVVAADMIRVLPAALPVRRAVLAEPLAVALHGAGRAGDLTGARVLVSGAGPIGLLAVAAAQSRGAAEVVATDVLTEPLVRAAALGAEVIMAGEGAIAPESFDVVLECSGAAAALSTALAAVRRRGVVVQIGMLPDQARPINAAPLVSKEVSLRGAFRFHDEIDEAIDLLTARAEIEQVITHVLPVSAGDAAFEIAKDPTRSGKVVVAMRDTQIGA